jgi:hypothetical protein
LKIYIQKVSRRVGDPGATLNGLASGQIPAAGYVSWETERLLLSWTAIMSVYNRPTVWLQVEDDEDSWEMKLGDEKFNLSAAG